MKSEKLLFVGDVVPNAPFEFGVGVKRLCKEHSWRIFNLEGSFSFRDSPIPLFKAGPNLLLDESYFTPILENFNIAVLANNHTTDFCEEGLYQTITVCKDMELYTVGAGKNIEEAFCPIITKDCLIISVAEHEFGGASENKYGIATVEETARIYSAIRDGKECAKYVIVVAHGGAELISIPPPYLRKRYKTWIDYGADLIIGNHPHVPQGKEVYKEKNIFYSLGNFAFPTFETYLSEIEVSEYPDCTWSIAVSVDIEQNEVKVIPIRPKIIEKGFKICISDRIQDKVRFKSLCDQIVSPDYFENYKKISEKLYLEWYDGRLKVGDKDDVAYLLHLFRREAHRDIIQTELSRRIGEI